MGAGTIGNGNRKRRGRFYQPPMSEINVTPFVDVMLVLLIIFMVTAPLLTVGVPIELPKTEAKQVSGDKEPLVISVNVGGKVYLQETEITLDEIAPKLKAITKSGFNESIYIRGDRRTDHGTVMKVLGTLNKAGFSRITFITDVEDGS